MTYQKTNRGFTIVELLIVIVVIAILAAISIVAYNGIQNRARNTTNAQTASQLKSKIESWHSVMGSYPSVTELNNNLDSSRVSEAKIEGSLAANFNAVAATVVNSGSNPYQPGADTAQPIRAYPCGSATTPTGYVIVWGTTPADPDAKTILGC